MVFAFMSVLMICTTVVIVLVLMQHERDMQRDFLIEQTKLIIEMKKLGIESEVEEDD